MRKVGSRRGDARRRAILAAATEVFLARGFAGATLDAVIARAGGSRATLYDAFGDKEGLFAAIIADLCERMLRPLVAGREGGDDPEGVLTAFARVFMAHLMDPTSLALYRLVVGESRRFPALGARVFRAGPEMAATRLAEYLRAATRRGRLRVRRPEMAARALLEAVKGDLHTRALFGVGETPGPAEIDSAVAEAVRIFLDGVARK